MELISVIVPVYNMDQFIRKSLDSLLIQTYGNYEVILVNDGSTDKSGLICDEYVSKHKNVSVLHKKNGGLSSARNAGIDIAKGKFVIFPDPDDWVEKDYLTFLYNLQQGTNADLSICGHYVNSDSGCVRQTNGELQFLGREDAILMLFRSDAFCGFSCNKLYKMEIIEKHHLRFDVELGMAQDLHFAFRYFLKSANFVYHPIPKYHYYQHSGGVTNSGLTPRRLSGLQSYKKIQEIAEKEFPQAVNLVKGTIGNMSLTFIENYYTSNMVDKVLLNELKRNIYNNKRAFFTSNQYSFLRKLLGLIGMFSPKTFFQIRKISNFSR